MSIRLSRITLAAIFLLLVLELAAPRAGAILAGGEFDLPEDRPSQRIDPLVLDSDFNFVGGLSISSGGNDYRGTGIALTSRWMLTAAHNLDFNDDGVVDPGVGVSFHLPGWGAVAGTEFHLHPGFSGFGSPSLHHDLALIGLDTDLPQLNYPRLGAAGAVNDTITLVGFGRSGFGSYGYTTSASLSERRIGSNRIDTIDVETSGSGALFRYDFDAPDSFGQAGGSLGNTVETLIAPGDSGGPVLREGAGSVFELIAVSTFTEGFGGRFGDTGGGVPLDPAWDWISDITGLAIIPEVNFFGPLSGAFLSSALLTRSSRRLV